MAVPININEIFEVSKYRANQNGYLGTISHGQFNLLFPRACIRYYNKIYAEYAATQRYSDSVSPFKSDPLTITIPTTGKYPSPCDLFHVDALMYASPCTPYQPTVIQRIESQRLANNLSSTYEAPDLDFPIYGEYSDYLQFYPVTLGNAILIYLKIPVPAFWAYTLNGSIGVLGTITPGSGYVNGSYINVPLTGGSGNSALANITVAGGVITAVTITSMGFQYKAGDVLHASNTLLGGSGSGFGVVVSTITNARPTYDPVNSVDCSFQIDDIDNIIYLFLMDVGIQQRDQELESFSLTQSKINV